MKPGRGRPVRFLAIVTVGWVGMRVLLLLPDAAHVVGQGAVPAVRKEAAILIAAGTDAARPMAQADRPVAMPRSFRTPLPAPAKTVAVALVRPVEPEEAAPMVADEPAGPLLLRPDLPPAVARPGLSGSLWLMTRGGAAGGPVQLGGGQAGLRLRLPVDRMNRLALVGRIATPLAGQGSEAAFGVEWRPRGGAVAIVAEQRVALDSGDDATGLGIIAGIDHVLREKIVVEGYGQAGLVRRTRTEAYADGAARLLYRAGERVRIGGGSWGVAQRGGARFDIGPSAVLLLPVGGKQARLSLDWRQRVAGNAAPGSGFALTLGSDF